MEHPESSKSPCLHEDSRAQPNLRHAIINRNAVWIEEEDFSERALRDVLAIDELEAGVVQGHDVDAGCAGAYTASKVLSLIRFISLLNQMECRICYEREPLKELINPCNCTGTMGVVHQSCLKKWVLTK